MQMMMLILLLSARMLMILLMLGLLLFLGDAPPVHQMPVPMLDSGMDWLRLLSASSSTLNIIMASVRLLLNLLGASITPLLICDLP